MRCTSTEALHEYNYDGTLSPSLACSFRRPWDGPEFEGFQLLKRPLDYRGSLLPSCYRIYLIPPQIASI